MTGLRRSLFGMVFLAVAALVLTGCPASPSKKDGDKKAKEDEHPTKGPHGGPLAELGDKEEFHAELMTDKTKKQATVYILDGKAKKLVPIKAKEITLIIKGEKKPITLAADPQKEDKDGASRFVGTHDKFGEDLDPDEVEASVVMTEGKPPLVGTFQPDEKDHKHDHKKDKK